jgi:threonine dehydrogenase-like Zn-dependent dehydrogenase
VTGTVVASGGDDETAQLSVLESGEPIEATGIAPIVFEAMEALGKNGVIVLTSVTGGNQAAEVPAAKINLEFVLGNNVMVGTVNGNREYFEAAIRSGEARAQFPGWAERC